MVEYFGGFVCAIFDFILQKNRDFSKTSTYLAGKLDKTEVVQLVSLKVGTKWYPPLVGPLEPECRSYIPYTKRRIVFSVRLCQGDSARYLILWDAGSRARLR